MRYPQMCQNLSVLDEIGLFVRAVFRKWQAIITGSLIAVAYWVAPALGFTTIRRRYYVLAALLALIVATFLAWRDEVLRADRATLRAEKAEGELKSIGAAAPAAALQVRVTESEVFIDVTNTGAIQAEFQLRATSIIQARANATFDVAWAQGKQGPRLLPSGETSAVKVARLDVNRGLFQWLLFSPRARSENEYRTQERPGVVAHVRAPEPGAVDLTITAIATPQLRDGVEKKTLRFRGMEVTDDSGEVFRLEGKPNTLLSL